MGALGDAADKRFTLGYQRFTGTLRMLQMRDSLVYHRYSLDTLEMILMGDSLGYQRFTGLLYYTGEYTGEYC